MVNTHDIPHCPTPVFQTAPLLHYLLRVVFAQPLELLALVVFDIVEHGVDLACLRRRFVSLVAVAATVSTDQVHQPEPYEDASNALENQCQCQE